MVQYNRIELLNHPVCKKYLRMKWCVRATFDDLLTWIVVPSWQSRFVLIRRVAYGSRAHLLNMFLYLLGLLPLTHLIVNLRPTMNTTDTGEHSIVMVPSAFSEVLMHIFKIAASSYYDTVFIISVIIIIISQQSVFLSFCMVMVLIMNIYCIGKEVVQISQQVPL